jgi:hypothetical protein
MHVGKYIIFNVSNDKMDLTNRIAKQDLLSLSINTSIWFSHVRNLSIFNPKKRYIGSVWNLTV